jgi:hypothetical protein
MAKSRFSAKTHQSTAGRKEYLMKLDPKIPAGPLAQKWSNHRNPHQADQSGQQAEVLMSL